MCMYIYIYVYTHKCIFMYICVCTRTFSLRRCCSLLLMISHTERCTYMIHHMRAHHHHTLETMAILWNYVTQAGCASYGLKHSHSCACVAFELKHSHSCADLCIRGSECPTLQRGFRSPHATRKQITGLNQ